MIVDLGNTEHFITYHEDWFVIEDLSSADVPTGTFEMIVTLTDGKNSLITDIQVLVYAAPIFEDSDSAGGAFGYFEGVTEENSGGGASNSTTITDADNSALEIQNKIIQDQVEKWRLDMFNREQELYYKQGQFQLGQYSPPEPRIKFIW